MLGMRREWCHETWYLLPLSRWQSPMYVGAIPWCWKLQRASRAAHVFIKKEYFIFMCQIKSISKVHLSQVVPSSQHHCGRDNHGHLLVQPVHLSQAPGWRLGGLLNSARKGLRKMEARENLGGEGGKKTSPEGWKFLTFSLSFCDRRQWALWEKAKVVLTTVFFCEIWLFIQ